MIKKVLERNRRERRRDIFLAGIAKHSRVIERHRLAIATEDVFRSGRPCYAPVPPEIQIKVYDWAEYVQSPEANDTDKEQPKFNMGAMHLVRFGKQAADPIWTIDLLQFQVTKAQQIFGSLLADAEQGFPVPCYPHCLQQADRSAPVVALDLAILQHPI